MSNENPLSNTSCLLFLESNGQPALLSLDILFLIAGYAETNRTPFDLLEHEAEVVAGYATEYSGMRWGMFFIGEYTNMFIITFLVSLIFLGGFGAGGLLGGLALLGKVMFFICYFKIIV